MKNPWRKAAKRIANDRFTMRYVTIVNALYITLDIVWGL